MLATLPPYPCKQCCLCLQRDLDIVRGGRGDFAFNHVTKLVPNILVRIVFEDFFKRLLLVPKTKKTQLEGRAVSFIFLRR